jgi:hypothetical protein
MARGVVADYNLVGHLKLLIHILDGAEWGEVWRHLGLTVENFESLGISRDIIDSELWRLCQERELVLVTANRRSDEPDSLEATIAELNTPSSLPVFTLSNATRVIKNKAYANRVVVRLLEYLLDIGKYRGAGRLYLP